MTQYEQIAAALNDLERIIAETRFAITAGEPVDLEGLPEFAVAVRQKVTELPNEDGRLFAVRMSSLVEDLDSLTQDVAAKHRDLSARLASFEASQGIDGQTRGA